MPAKKRTPKPSNENPAEAHEKWLDECLKAGNEWNIVQDLIHRFWTCANVRIFPYVWVNPEKDESPARPGSVRLVARSDAPTKAQREEGIRLKRVTSERAAALLSPNVDISDVAFEKVCDALVLWCRRPIIDIEPTPFIDFHSLCTRTDVRNPKPLVQVQLTLVVSRVFETLRQVDAKLRDIAGIPPASCGPTMQRILDLEALAAAAVERPKTPDGNDRKSVQTGQAGECPVALGEPQDRPTVNGKRKQTLKFTQYAVIKVLVDDFPEGVKKATLIRKSGCPDAVGILKRLARKDPDWAEAIYFPRAKRDGYRIK